MTPDSVEWWFHQAQLARENARKDPTPELCCLYAMTLGRCSLMGKSLGDEFTLNIKRAITATESFVEMIQELQDRLKDISWMAKIWPEAIVQVTPSLIGRRVDIFGVQVIIDDTFDAASERYEKTIDKLSDDIVNALLDMDTEFNVALPFLRQHGNADKVLTYHRKRIKPEFHDQWWLAGQKKKGVKNE